MEKIDLGNLDYEELNKLILSWNEKSFRGKQIYEWIHKKLVSNIDDFSNISKELREKLKEETHLTKLEKHTVLHSKKDKTNKYLFQLEDGNIIESVWMKYDYGNSVCISSQVGCRMGCKFCASTIGGLKRNLTAFEMLSEIYEIQKDTGERVSNVVIMGTGEPLDNFDEIVKFIKMLSDEHGLNISTRNITLSTCGIVPNIIRLADLKLPITFALSLHGTTQEKRKKVLPVANKYHLPEVIDACRYYSDTTGRRVSLEYSLIDGKNDTKEDADELIKIAKKIKAHINLIPVNPIEERDFKKPDKTKIEKFKNELEKNGINVTIRKERGSDINGACGQLRLGAMKERYT
ncbi:MAG: 23S rRNA (adenine(2503)-C(2))-methyltransferase RlmN [Lachnospiraceae bacterium]|nr:23S rRNA (adenine(2503)-C(2))-methyltransferase RlmN [Lachnospiraceae bacterium]